MIFSSCPSRQISGLPEEPPPESAFDGTLRPVAYDLSHGGEALGLTAEVVPILESRRLYEETLAAVGLLGQAIERGEVAGSLLREVRDAVLRDPLIALSP